MSYKVTAGKILFYQFFNFIARNQTKKYAQIFQGNKYFRMNTIEHASLQKISKEFLLLSY